MVTRHIHEENGWTDPVLAVRGLVLGLALVGLLASCASPPRRVDSQGRTHFDTPPEELERLRSAPVCCRTFAQFPFEPLDLQKGGRISFRIDHASPAFNFDWGKSYFKAFSLPPAKQFYSVIIASSGYFAHAALTLDADFRVLSDWRARDRLVFNAVGPRFPIAYLERETVIRPADRYLVIFTTDELLRSATVTRETLKLPLGSSTSTSVHWHRPIGQLSITQPYPAE